MIRRGLKLFNNRFPGLQRYAQRCADLGAVGQTKPDGWVEIWEELVREVGESHGAKESE